MLEYTLLGGHRVVVLRFPESQKRFELSAGVCYHEPEKVMVTLRSWHEQWAKHELEQQVKERTVTNGDSGNDDGNDRPAQDAGPTDAGTSECDGAEDNARPSDSD